MRLTVLRFLLTFLMLAASASHGKPIIDQEQPNFPDHMAHFRQTGMAQSFQQSHDNIAGAGIRLQAGVGAADTVTITLWDDLPGQVGATMLVSASGVAVAGTWFDVFWGAQAITPGSTYYLVFTSLNNTLGVAGDTNDPYAFGQTHANAFATFPTYDYAFRTFFEPIASPASASLLGLGLVGIMFVRRRREAPCGARDSFN